MLCLTLAAHSSLFPLKNWEPILSFAFIPCITTSRMEAGSKCFPWLKPFLQVQLENNLFILFEKNCYTPYSLLNVLIMSFLIFYFSFRFCSTWWCQNIRKHFLYFQSFWSETKFSSINWYNIRGYLVSWGGSSSANFNFHYHWNLFKNNKLPTLKSKIITFHLGKPYC